MGENNASWHNSCRNLFSEYRLQRVVTSNKKNRKRKSTRSTTAAFEKTKCVFCQEDLTKDLHKCANSMIRWNEWHNTLEDDRLIGLFEQGDVVALDIQYHRDCLTTYERAYTRKISPARVEFSTTDVAKEEIMSKIEDDISSGVTVFSMHDLINNYQTLLGDTVSTVNHTRLKHDILIRFPDFQEQLGSRRCIYLIASKEMRQIVSDNITDTDRQASAILVKAAMICRRAVSSTKPYKFGGSLHPSHDIQYSHRDLWKSAISTINRDRGPGNHSPKILAISRNASLYRGRPRCFAAVRGEREIGLDIGADSRD